jgi:endonuclease/exonuclease/phosphatase family metal-dependent hydrolase
MATWALFVERDSDLRLFHLNTHLDHLVPTARRKGAQLIQRRLPRNVPCVVTGDMNAIQSGRTYRILTGAKGAGLTDSRWASRTPLLRHWNATFHRFTGRGLYRIDYILGRGLVDYEHYQVVRDRVDGRLPSDHFPVVTDLAIAA